MDERKGSCGCAGTIRQPRPVKCEEATAKSLTAAHPAITGTAAGNAKGAQTDRATWPLTTYPRAERPGICQDSYSPGRFETMKNFTRSKEPLAGERLVKVRLGCSSAPACG
jgi:hypothetical protein